MSMAHERTRALHWAYESLEVIRDCTALAVSQRDRAEMLLRDFPSPHEVSTWIKSEARSLPSSAAAAIDAAGALMRDIWCSDICPSDLREDLRFSLRHYPAQGEVNRWTREIGNRTITDWLLPEDH